jgi:hypothetical protein
LKQSVRDSKINKVLSWGDGDKVVEFTYGGVNLFASHKLKYLDFTKGPSNSLLLPPI